MSKTIIIIGAGISGLSAGCYGQMNGYSTQIFEMNAVAGGLCTSWQRSGYTFDGCIHWLCGSGPGNSVFRVWEELGAHKDQHIIDHDEFMRIQGPDGKTLVIYTDLDELEHHLKVLAPEDTQVIEEFIDAMRVLSRFNPPVGRPRELFGPLGGREMLDNMAPFLPILEKWSKISLQDFANRFSNRFLCDAFPLILGIDPDFPMLGFMMNLAFMHNRSAGYPVGGALKFARAIERRYLDLGGKIHYQSRVEKIIVENDQAVGVRLSQPDECEYRADKIISAADGHTTIFEMLDGKYANEEIRRNYETIPIFKPVVRVSIGLAQDMCEQPHSITYMLPEPIIIAGEKHSSINVRNYCYDPSLAPKGKSVIISLFQSNYVYWDKLARDRKEYEAEKEHVSQEVISQLDKLYPGLASAVEVVDVSTPLTTERYTGNWQGAIEGWFPTTEAGMTVGKGISKTLPGLGSFYMIGQWVEPGGGLSNVAISGRNIIQIICKQDNKSFITSLCR